MRRLPRIPAIGLAVAALALAACREERKLPPVVLVTLDTTRADFFGAHGRAGDPTPHFDALAAKGVWFERAVTSSAVTPVAHASILSGTYQFRHGLRVLSAAGGYRMRPDIPTITSSLRARGYRTAAVHSAFPVSDHFGLGRDFEHFDSIELDLAGGRAWDVLGGQRRSDRTTDRVLSLLEEEDDRPLFLWVHYWDPHDVELLPPARFLPRDLPRLEDGTILPSSRVYQAELTFVDLQFGRLMAALEEHDLADDALIVVTADHGEGLEDGLERHGWFFHRILYQEQMHVPLIVKPPRSRSGRRVADLVRTVDVYPTVLDYVGLPLPGELDGRSLRALAEGRRDAPRTAYADQINLFDSNAQMLLYRPQAAFIFAALEDRWKLIYRPLAPETSELFDLHADPLELVDLFQTEREVVHRLARILRDHEGWVFEPLPADPHATPEMRAAANAALTALGYTGGDEGTGLGRDASEDWRWYDVVSREVRDIPPTGGDGIWLPAYVGPFTLPGRLAGGDE
jgi:arylsulfatase A-like enzyme